MSWGGRGRGRESEKTTRKLKWEKMKSAEEEPMVTELDHSPSPPFPALQPPCGARTRRKHQWAQRGQQAFTTGKWTSSGIKIWWKEKVRTRCRNLFILWLASLAARRIREFTGGNCGKEAVRVRQHWAQAQGYVHSCLLTPLQMGLIFRVKSISKPKPEILWFQ